MTMRFIPNTSIPNDSNWTPRTLFAFLDFMRSASPTGPGWTISRSSDGTTGGAGDNITTFTDLNQYVAATSISWFVLRQPDGGREFLWYRVNTSNATWALRYSPTAAFTGGTIAAIPTAVDGQEVHGSGFPANNAQNLHVLHMGADDAAPYGWFYWLHQSGSFASARGAYMMIPITGGVQAGEVDPMVFYNGLQTSGFSSSGFQSETETTPSVQGATPGVANFQAIPGVALSAGPNDVFPNNCAQDDNGDDVSVPMIFARRAALGNPGFKGISDFVQWNGTTRAAGETFSSLTRVSLNDVNVPWDGTTTPSST